MSVVAPLAYGYIRTAVERDSYLRSCQEELAQWCARRGVILGGTFTDIGSPLDVDDRMGFSGLLQALAMPSVKAAVILNSSHLSSRPDVVTNLVVKIRRTGAALWVRDGGLPTLAAKHCRGQAEPR